MPRPRIAEEPRRYAQLVESLEAQWLECRAAAPPGGDPDAEPTLPYVPLLRVLCSSRADVDPTVIDRLVRLLLDIVLATEGDLAAQTRWAQQLHTLLRVHRRKLPGLEVPWRPLYDTIRRTCLEPTAHYEGARVCS